jgi:acyl-CoA dehydrogenase
VLVHTDMSATHISRRGAEAQERQYLPGIIAGEKVVAIAVTEAWRRVRRRGHEDPCRS